MPEESMRRLKEPVSDDRVLMDMRKQWTRILLVYDAGLVQW